MLAIYHARVEAAALAIARRRGLGNINKEHPMWEYFINDAKDALSAAAQAETPELNREIDDIMAWVRSLPDERQWLPIKTAPYGHILGWIPFQHGGGMRAIIYKDDADCWCDDNDDQLEPEYQPTLWQHLPLEPEALAQAQDKHE